MPVYAFTVHFNVLEGIPSAHSKSFAATARWATPAAAPRALVHRASDVGVSSRAPLSLRSLQSPAAPCELRPRRALRPPGEPESPRKVRRRPRWPSPFLRTCVWC